MKRYRIVFNKIVTKELKLRHISNKYKQKFNKMKNKTNAKLKKKYNNL